MTNDLNRQDSENAKARQEPSIEVDGLARSVIGAAIDVHRVLGLGFLESVYEEALCAELTARGVRYARQVVVEVGYKGAKVGEQRIDLMVETQLIVELKAVEHLLPIHTAQLRSYLKATGAQFGLLMNFNVELLKSGLRRVVLTA